MKTKKLISILFCLCASILYAQRWNITGIVKDAATIQGVEFATVSLSKPDSTVITGCTTNSSGNFLIENVQKGTYILRASFVGYKSYSKVISVTSSRIIEDIILAEDKKMLKEVVVEAKRPFIQQKIDKYVVNISDHLLTAGKNGMDILKFTPGLLVQNKNISILGEQVDVWIDGRPSHMDQNALSAYLEGMQAENIDKIEIITNPSSKYDAGGGRGIINIKTKKNQNIDVLYGSVNFGYERSQRDKGFGGLELSYRTQKLNVYGNYGFRGGTDMSTIHEITTISSQNTNRTYDKQLNFDVHQSNVNNHKIGIDFFPDKSNIIGFLFNGFNNIDAANSNSKTNISPSLNNTSLSLMSGNYKNSFNGAMYNTNYKHLFSKEGVEFNVDVDYGHITNTQNQEQNYTFFSQLGSEPDSTSSQRNRLPQLTEVWSVKIDYQHPVSETFYWDAGMKAGGTHTDNNIVYEQFENSNWQNDESKSNHFKYEENIYALYANVGKRFKKWGFQTGLRGEYTYSIGNQILTKKNKKTYLDVFPTLFVQYVPQENHEFVLSFSRRINRPNYQTLNPFEMALDNYSYIAGNPNLSPSYNNNIELKYTFYHKLTATLNWTRNNRMILPEPVADTINNRYGYVYNNFGNRTAYICMLNYNDDFFKFWRIGFMGQLAYIENRSDKAIANFNNDGISAAIWLNNTFQLNKTLSAEISLLLLPSIRMGYTRSDMLTNNLSCGIRKNIFNNNGTISLTANDILKGQITKNTTQLNNTHIYTHEDNNQRNLSISFSYRFGSSKAEKARTRDTGIEEEVGRTQNIKK